MVVHIKDTMFDYLWGRENEKWKKKKEGKGKSKEIVKDYVLKISESIFHISLMNFSLSTLGCIFAFLPTLSCSLFGTNIFLLFFFYYSHILQLCITSETSQKGVIEVLLKPLGGEVGKSLHLFPICSCIYCSSECLEYACSACVPTALYKLQRKDEQWQSEDVYSWKFWMRKFQSILLLAVGFRTRLKSW